jgi:hypothetical protein
MTVTPIIHPTKIVQPTPMTFQMGISSIPLTGEQVTSGGQPLFVGKSSTWGKQPPSGQQLARRQPLVVGKHPALGQQPTSRGKQPIWGKSLTGN